MSRVFSVCIVVVIGAILVKPDILLWIPALNSPNVDTNVGVITILLAVWTIVRDSLKTSNHRLLPQSSPPLVINQPQTNTREPDASDIPPPVYAPATSITDQIVIPPPAPTGDTMLPDAPDAPYQWLSTDMLLRGAVIIAALYFFVRVFVG